ncbi:MAG: MFS transporter [Methylococcaceae bacterium]|nr:MFS transporter [Methylococcaceae bacterium]
MTSHSPLPLKNKLAYGFGALAYSVPNQIMASFFLFYVTVILHVSPMNAGVIIAISVLWDAVTDPWLGHVSDRTQSDRFGRRHLYLIIGGVGTAIGTVFLWSISPDSSAIYKITMLLFLVLLTKTMLTFYGAPYFAIGGSISNNYDERSSIQSYRAVFHIIGVIIAIAGMTVIFFKTTATYPKGQLNPEAYPAMGYTIALITLIVSLIAVVIIPKDRIQPSRNKVEHKTKVWQLAVNSLKNANFRAIIVMIFLLEIAFQVSISINFHVSTYTYNLTGPQIGFIGVTILIFSILSQPFWVSFSRRFEKKTALLLGMIFGVIGFSGQPLSFVFLEWFPLNQPQTIYIMAGFSVLSGIGNGAFMSLPFSMVADSVDQGEIHTGQREEGLYFGLYNFAYKAGISISILMGGIMLDFIGFDAMLTEQAAEVAYNLAMVPAWLLLALSPLIYWSASKYQLDRKMHNDVLTTLERRATALEST